jgi:cyanophycinase
LVIAEGGGLDARSAYGRQVLGRCLAHIKAGGTHASRFIVLGAVAPDADDPRLEVALELGASFAENVMAGENGVGHAEAAAAIDRADIVFIRGGDQSRYVKFWMNSPVRAALQRVPLRGGVVIGSSAGCAVLSEWVYDAVHGGLGPLDSLRDGRHPDLTITHPFLGYARGVLFDTHFIERARFPRLAAMLGVIARPILGIGIEASTAVIVSGEPHAQVGEVVGEGVVTLLRAGPACASLTPVGRPPTVTGLRMDILAPGTRFSLQDGTVISRPDWVRASDHAGEQPRETSFEACSVQGREPDDAKAGLRRVVIEKEKALLTTGEGKVPWLVLTGLWSGLPRAGAWMAMLRAIAEQPGAMLLVADSGTRLDFGDDGGVRVEAGEEGPPASAMVLASRDLAWVGVGDQHVHLEGLRLDVLAPGWAADLVHGGVEPPEGVTLVPMRDLQNNDNLDDPIDAALDAADIPDK